MTAQGEDILAWLNAAIADRERKATEAAEAYGANWYYDDGFVLARHEDDMVATGSQDFLDREQGEHVALHDPASVLRRCATDRKLLARHASHLSGSVECSKRCVLAHPDVLVCDHDAYRWPCPDVVDLAEGYGWAGGER